ncbi:MAG: PEP-CTERM sorting domain-containing protein [Pirellulales bacterium]
MKTPTIALVALLLAGASTARAITINATYRAPGQILTNFGLAQTTPANAVGGGTLQALVAAAVTYWQNAYADPFTLTLEYGWFPRSGSTTGTHSLLTEGGSPHRELSASLAFDSDQSTIWFVDPTPADNSEFALYQEYYSNLGGGIMNVGREYTNGTGDASRHDLFSTVLHEMGHALGLSASNNAYVAETSVDTDIDLTSPRAYAGAAIPVNAGDAHLNLTHPLMRSSRPSAVRRLASEADILANAQISQFQQINLAPAVPEPQTVLLLAAGLAALPLVRRRLRRAAVRA